MIAYNLIRKRQVRIRSPLLAILFQVSQNHDQNSQKNGKNRFVRFSSFSDELNWFHQRKIYQSPLNVKVNVCSKKFRQFKTLTHFDCSSKIQKLIFFNFRNFKPDFEELCALLWWNWFKNCIQHTRMNV